MKEFLAAVVIILIMLISFAIGNGAGFSDGVNKGVSKVIRYCEVDNMYFENGLAMQCQVQRGKADKVTRISE